VTRVLSAFVLILVVCGIILFLPFFVTFFLAEVAAALAFVEYVGLARASGIEIPRIPAAVATLVTVAVIPWAPGALLVVLMAAGLVLSVTILADGPNDGVLSRLGIAVFAVIYIGLPLGSLAAVQLQVGREALLLLLTTVMVSDTAQYYGGRLFGRRKLAPAISPKKTVEGAACGILAASVVFFWFAALVFPQMGVVGRVFLGVTLASLGIGGDLFESCIKRSSGVKDSSQLIPGHGGVLDRIDALLFAGPVYYTVVVYLAGVLP